MITPSNYKATLELLNLVCKETNTTIEELRGKTRERRVTEARQIFFDILFSHSSIRPCTLQEAGVFIGRDHSTVLHSIKMSKNLKQFDKAFKEKFDRVFQQVALLPEFGLIEFINFNNIPQY